MYSVYPGVVNTAQDQYPPELIEAFCAGSAWWWCNCVTDRTFALNRSHCALTAAQGAASLAYVAAAPTALLQRQDGRFYNLCVPLGAPADQYRELAIVKSEAAAAEYAQSLTALWRSWTRPPPTFK
jgi:hypothetical protein